MNTTLRKPVTLALLLLLVLMLGACASNSPPSQPVVVNPPRIPPPPQVIAPLASGSYWRQHCSLMRSMQRTLKLTPMPSEPCSRPGLTE